MSDARSKVSIVRCPDYEPMRLKVAVKEAFDLIGGIKKFVPKGGRILLKPNLLSARTPEEAVDTHPEFVRAVGEIVRDAGGVPVIGDSPGSFFTVKSIDEVYERSGMKKMADEEGFELTRFDKMFYVKGYPIARAARDFDLVISLPKLKSHTLTMLTGAVKNTYGFVPGLGKVEFHKKAPHINEFSKIIADVFSFTKPGLSIMDGIVGMDSDGPAAGRVRGFGLVLASADAVSIDAVVSHLTGLPYERNAILRGY